MNQFKEEQKAPPLTMFDFTDCISNEPMFGEVGYKDDIRDLLEYPCNCVYCLEKAGVYVEDSDARTRRAEGDD